MKHSDLFRNEADYPDLSQEAAVAHLQGALQIPTVSYVDTSRMDYSQWDCLYAYLRESYPVLSRCALWERIGHSILITIQGSCSDLKPALFMSHMDVVPIQPGTEARWLHGPFSGDVADGYIWGRGAMDIKEMLVGILESAEYLLRSGRSFARTVYLAFGEDEETCSQGAIAIVRILQQRGVTLAYVLDEGAGDVIPASDWGAPGATLCSIGMYEKGYADLQLSVQSQGGHSSNPYHGTSLQKLAKAITAIVENMPPAQLSPAILETFQTLGEQVTVAPLCDWVQDMDSHKEEILDWMLSRESTYHLVRTTVAPTMITPGAPAGNVMPQNMEAVINFRLIPEDTPESLMERFRQMVEQDVQLQWVQQIGASTPSDTGAYGFAALKQVLEHYFDKLLFVPMQNKGATDARNYEPICRCVMRFGPFLEEEDITAEGIHGTNERISIRAYMQGIRVILRLMEATCVMSGGQND